MLTSQPCCSRHGHNELDDPSVTLPLTYQLLENHPTAVAQYKDRLLADEMVSQEGWEEWEDKVWRSYEEGAPLLPP